MFGHFHIMELRMSYVLTAFAFWCLGYWHTEIMQLVHWLWAKFGPKPSM